LDKIMPASNSIRESGAVPKPLIDKISALPQARLAEVEDFVDFIGQRELQQHSERTLIHAHAEISAPAFANVWNNAEDDVYDGL
jgi:hypothetical protein